MNFIDNIDWKLLREQKLVLLELVGDGRINPSEEAALDGIISVIDAVQDYAADEMGYGEKEVFG